MRWFRLRHRLIPLPTSTRLAAILAAAIAALLAPALAHAANPNEVKAEMLCMIAKFVKWPETSYAATGGQLRVAILGEDDLAGVVASTLSRKTVNGRPVFVQCVRRVEDARDSQILFIARSAGDCAPDVVHTLGNSAVLTVADSDGFVARGGMVDFFLEADKVRFQINPGTAERAGLKISAKLLALARIAADTP